MRGILSLWSLLSLVFENNRVVTFSPSPTANNAISGGAFKQFSKQPNKVNFGLPPKLPELASEGALIADCVLVPATSNQPLEMRILDDRTKTLAPDRP
jgi:hypothetical protein